MYWGENVKKKPLDIVIENKQNYVSISTVAYLIGVSTVTIIRWYKWWENSEFEKPEGLQLPEYYFMDRRRTKYFKKADIPILKEFKLRLATTHKGCMADFNATYQWGVKGKEILKKKGIDYKKVQGKIH